MNNFQATDAATFSQHLLEEKTRHLAIIEERITELKTALGGATGQVGALLALPHCVSLLKRQKRRGWNDRKNVVDQPESVADHELGMITIVWWVAKKYGLNVEKAMSLAWIHDFIEFATTDINHYNYSAELRPHIRAMKEELEAHALQLLTKLLDEIDPVEQLGQQIMALINEYEERKTPEARLAKLADMLEVSVQAVNYDRNPTNRVDAESFLHNVVPVLKDDKLFFAALQHLEQQLETQRRLRAAA